MPEGYQVTEVMGGAGVCCIICGGPVDRGAPGSGYVAGLQAEGDVHTACWPDSVDEAFDALERIAIMLEGEQS